MEKSLEREVTAGQPTISNPEAVFDFMIARFPELPKRLWIFLDANGPNAKKNRLLCRFLAIFRALMKPVGGSAAYHKRSSSNHISRIYTSSTAVPR